MCREDLKPLELAHAFELVMDRTGWTASRLAKELHLNPSTVGRALDLLTLPEGLKTEVNEARLVPGVARELGRLDSEAEMQSLAQEAKEYGYTSEQMRQIVSSRLRQSKTGKRPAKPTRTKQTFKLNQWVAEVEPKRVILRFAARRGKATREETLRALKALVRQLDGGTDGEGDPASSNGVLTDPFNLLEEETS